MRTHSENEGLSLSDLMSAYLNTQAARFGETGERPGSGSEVELHEATTHSARPAPGVEGGDDEARLGTSSARTARRRGRPCPTGRRWSRPRNRRSTWPFAAGNFPQMVRNLNLLLQGAVPGRGLPSAAWATPH